MSAPIPKTAMVFAAGLGPHAPDHRDAAEAARQGARARADRPLPRPAGGERRRDGDRQRPLARRPDRGASRAPRRIRASSSPTSASKLLDQGGGIKRVLPLLGAAPFLICNTDAFWIEGPRSNIARLAEAFDPEAMDIALLVAASAGAVGVDWPGDFTMTRRGPARVARGPRSSRPSSIRASASSSPSSSPARTARSSASPPFSTPPPARGRLFGVRLDGLWLHVGRPEVDRRGGSGRSSGRSSEPRSNGAPAPPICPNARKWPMSARRSGRRGEPRPEANHADETAERDRPHPLRRHRRHRHVRHRRGAAQSRLQGAGLGRQPTTPTSSACASKGATVFVGHDAANLGDAAVVVVSTAIKRDNPEARRGARRAHPGACAAPRCWPS